MITVYTFTVCPYCIQAKQLLTSIGAQYTEVDITGDDEKMQELTKRSGMRTVPQIYVDDECLGGYSDIAGLHEKWELVGKLGLGEWVST